MGIGAVCACPRCSSTCGSRRLIDRYDPEPWWALALVLGWGAIAACGVAATVNTGVEDLDHRPAGRKEASGTWSARASRRPSSRRR